MRFVVLVKQVPDTREIEMDPVSGTLQRKGVPAILNPFCEYALDMALRLKQEHRGSSVVSLSMGPPQAEAALLRCLELGADQAWLITDRAIAGSDCLATAQVLAASVRSLVPDFDLILCGKQAIDGDTAQVPAETAELLDIPQIYNCLSLRVEPQGVRAVTETGCGRETLRAPLPALVAIATGTNIRRMPSLAAMLQARQQGVGRVSLQEIGLSPRLTGAQGSPTRVVQIEKVVLERHGRLLDAREEPEVALEPLLELFASVPACRLGTNHGH